MVSLSHHLIHQYGRAHRHIERVEMSQHGYADMGVGSLSPSVCKSRSLSAHDDGSGLTHVSVVIECGIL